MWTTNHKLAGWVNMVFDFIVEKMCVFRILCFYPWDQDIDDIFLDLCQHAFFFTKIIMLCRNNDRINTYRLVVIIIFQRNLAFCIRTQVFDFFILPA